MTDFEKLLVNNERTIKQITLSFPNHEINNIENDQIYQESLNLEESLFDGETITFGKCNASILKIRVADFTEDIKDAEMDVSVKFENHEIAPTEYYGDSSPQDHVTYIEGEENPVYPGIEENDEYSDLSNGTIYKLTQVAISRTYEPETEQYIIDWYATWTYVGTFPQEVTVSFGKYIIQSVERTSDRRWRDITAVDFMSKFDVDVADWYNNTLYGEDWDLSDVDYNGVGQPLSSVTYEQGEENPVYPGLEINDTYLNVTDGKIYTLTDTMGRDWYDYETGKWMTELFMTWTYTSDGQKVPVTERTVIEIRERLCQYIGVTYQNTTLINDSLVITKTIEPQSLSARDLLQNVCEINGVFGHFDWNGVLNFISLEISGLYPSITLYPSDNLYPRTHGGLSGAEQITTFRESNYEDFDVERINAVGIQKEDGDLSVCYQLPEVVSQEEVENRYTIRGNVLLYGFTTQQLQNIAQTICNKICYVSYRPNTTSIYSGIDMSLGQAYSVHAHLIVNSDVLDNTFDSYIFKRTINGIQAMFSQLEAMGSQYQPDVSSVDVMSDLKVISGQSAKYKRDLESLEVDYSNFKTGTNTHFEQTDSQIVLGVNSNGELVLVELTGNREQGTSFTVKASNISLEGKTLNLTSDTMAITSKYFNVNSNGETEITGESITKILRNNTTDVTSQYNLDSFIGTFESTDDFPTASEEYSGDIAVVLAWDEEHEGSPITIKYRKEGEPVSDVPTADVQTVYPNWSLNDLYLDTITGKVYKLTDVSAVVGWFTFEWTYQYDLSKGNSGLTYTCLGFSTGGNTTYGWNKIYDDYAYISTSRFAVIPGQMVFENGKININDKFLVDLEGNLNVNDKLTIDNQGNFDINDKFSVDKNGNVNVNDILKILNTGQMKVNDYFIVNADGSLNIGNGAFTVDTDGNTTANDMITNSLLAIDSIDLMGRGNDQAIASIAFSYEGTPMNPVGVLTLTADKIALDTVIDDVYINGNTAVLNADGIYSMQLATNTTSGYYIHVATSAGAYGITIWASDTKLKKNIEDTEQTALDKIKSIRFIQFDWKADDTHVDLGVSANQIEEIMPDAVFEVEQQEGSKYRELKNIDTSKMITYALKGVQELIEQNEKQQQQINNLNEELATLKQQVAFLMGKENSNG